MDPCESAQENGSTRERRDYFRIQEVLPVSIRRLEGPCPNAFILAETLPEASASPEQNEEDPDLPAALIHRLTRIETKLDLILARIAAINRDPPPPSRQVCLSASGIQLSTPVPLTEGDTVEVRLMISVEDKTWLVLYGRVSRSVTRVGGETDVAVCFFDMDLAVREALISYTLRRQREQIRRQREEKD